MKKRFWAGLAVALVLAATPVLAITASDVLDRMTEKERFGYITGAIDMAMYRAGAIERNEAKANCVFNYYYGKDAKGPAEVIATFQRFRDKPAIALIDTLIEKTCGK